jgi:tetratricopeptide (TPR) repeat protein
MHEFAGSKTEMIVEFKKETGGVLAQVKKATQNFRELEGIDNVQMLPPEISESISSLANQSRDFRTKLGYEAAMYECGPETATSEALVAVDQALRDLNQKNAPAGRMKILNFIKRYPLPARDNQKPLWRYAASVLNACDLARKSAEQHLERARSLEAAGNKSEALREYQEIYRVYPNAITADKIQLLQNEAH